LVLHIGFAEADPAAAGVSLTGLKKKNSLTPKGSGTAQKKQHI
jgi:hypothetical protein